MTDRSEAGRVAKGLTKAGRVPTCRDFDEDCASIPDKVYCYLYDPAKGMCPYLQENTDAQ
jgi:hypothetical protein